MNWLLSRLKEPSSWRGLVVIAGIVGYKLDPNLQDSIITAGVAIFALIEVIRKEQAEHATIPGQAFNPQAEIRKAEKP